MTKPERNIFVALAYLTRIVKAFTKHVSFFNEIPSQVSSLNYGKYIHRITLDHICLYIYLYFYLYAPSTLCIVCEKKVDWILDASWGNKCVSTLGLSTESHYIMHLLCIVDCTGYTAPTKMEIEMGRFEINKFNV